MSITNYTELQNAVMNWLDRSDLSNYVPDFITLTENYFNRQLRVRQMMKTVSITTVAGVGTLPTDYLQSIAVRGSGNNMLDPMDPEAFYSKYGDGHGGTTVVDPSATQQQPTLAQPHA